MERLMNMFRKVRPFCYRYQFFGFGRKYADISVQEVYAADVVRILGRPTISEFAEFIGISQPNATYKVKKLVSKGYLKKFTSSSDKRECRLEVGERYEALYSESDARMQRAFQHLGKEFSAEELETAILVLTAAYDYMKQEEET